MGVISEASTDGTKSGQRRTTTERMNTSITGVQREHTCGRAGKNDLPVLSRVPPERGGTKDTDLSSTWNEL